MLVASCVDIQRVYTHRSRTAHRPIRLQPWSCDCVTAATVPGTLAASALHLMINRQVRTCKEFIPIDHVREHEDRLHTGTSTEPQATAIDLDRGVADHSPT